MYKAIVTRANEDGTFDNVGMNKRRVTKSYATYSNLLKYGIPEIDRGIYIRAEIYTGTIFRPTNHIVYFNAKPRTTQQHPAVKSFEDTIQKELELIIPSTVNEYSSLESQETKDMSIKKLCNCKKEKPKQQAPVRYLPPAVHTFTYSVEKCGAKPVNKLRMCHRYFTSTKDMHNYIYNLKHTFADVSDSQEIVIHDYLILTPNNKKIS